MRPILYLILTSLFLSACGTKGPLYIPEQRYPQDVVEPTKEPGK